MEFVNSKNYKEMSERAAEIMVDFLKSKPDALFCVATGSSPTLSYELFIKKVKEQGIKTDRMRIVKLDEWCGLGGDNPATCEYYIREKLLRPLDIPEDRYIGFDGTNENAEEECGRIAAFLKENGGIDLCVLGIGRNGHLGLNEPCRELNPYVHKAVLQEITRGHSMLSSNGEAATAGYTIGIKDILNSKKVMLLITGADKKTPYENLKRDVISSEYPANYLKLHGDAVCIVDAESVSEGI